MEFSDIVEFLEDFVEQKWTYTKFKILQHGYIFALFTFNKSEKLVL
jgi:hypothetical protein